MSLQDIKQILSRIITLNKNLDENRLNTLLEAGGWEKQNKQDALSVFRILGAKEDAKQIIQETMPAQTEHREISTEVLDQELVIAPKNELSAEIKKDNVINFIPANLPIKEEDRQEIFITDNKPIELAEVKNIIPEKPVEKIIGAKEESKQMSEEARGINWVVWASIALIIFLLAFGYLSSN